MTETDLERREAYEFELPEGQIAASPPEDRARSRLMTVRGGDRAHGRFDELVGWLAPGDLLVVNDVRVSPCRLFARKESGGEVELLVLEAEREGEDWRAKVMARANRKLREGQRLWLPGPEGERVAVTYLRRREDGLSEVSLAWGGALETLLRGTGEMPLPPYIVKRRKALGMARHEASDRARYQTVYAKGEGSAVAAPTAGLHFTPELLARLEGDGVELARLRLDVGPGTFKPVTAERLDGHEMHSERYEIPEGLAAAIERTRARGGRVIAVGTTTVRSLEDQYARYGEVRAGRYETALFIKPGHRFGVIDGMITNFHLPGSTLIVLVAAFGGYEAVMAAYSDAVASGYRFYSYGDAMLVWPAAP